MGMDWFPELDWSKLKWQGWLHPDMFEGKVCQLPNDSKKGRVWMFSEKELVWFWKTPSAVWGVNDRNDQSQCGWEGKSCIGWIPSSPFFPSYLIDLYKCPIWKTLFLFFFGRILVNFCQQLKASWGRLKSAWPPNLLRRLLSKMKIGFQNLHRKGWQFTKEVT